MMSRILFRWMVLILWVCSMVFCLKTHLAVSGGLPKVGSYLPKLQLEAPAADQEIRYLGIGDAGGFSINQIGAPFALVEIVGVYCPRCHKQAPLFNRLFHMIQKIPELSSRLKMVAVAVGANATEVAYFQKHLRIPYPVLKDPKFEIHKRLGEPRTPFTMLITKEGRVLFSHLGVIDNMERFLVRIRRFVE